MDGKLTGTVPSGTVPLSRHGEQGYWGQSLKGQSPDFAPAALRLAGLAGAILGWRPEEFWRATPAELDAILTALAGAQTVPPDADLFTQLQEQFPDG